MKKIISFLLVMLLTVTASSGAILSLSKIKLPKKETPIASTVNDNYSSYFSKQEADLNLLKNEISTIGGHLESYSSEDEYLTAQQKMEQSTAKNTKPISALAASTSFEPVMQTITVMTTATGSEANGNYVASKPIANAVVRIDGVPRYTDRSGQVTVKIYREWVEIYVEKTTETEKYNPYIEIMSVMGGEKTVYLKQPSDDIEVHSVMLNNAGEWFNLLVQPCEINIDFGYYISEISVNCNIEADEYLLYKDGECIYSRDENLFEDIDFSDYKLGGGYSVQVVYQGIASKIYDLQLTVSELEEYTENPDKSGPNIDIEDDDPNASSSDSPSINFISNINLDFSWLLNSILTESFEKPSYNKEGKKTTNFLSKFESGVFYDIRKGTIEITVGYTWTPVDKTKNEYKDNEKQLEQYREKQIEKKAELNEKQKELNALKAEKAKNSTATLDNRIKEQQDEINRLAKQKKSGDEYKRAKQSQLDREANIAKMQAERTEKDKVLQPVLEAVKNGNATVEDLRKELNKLGGALKKGNPFSMFENKIKKFSVEIELLGKLKLQIFDVDNNTPTFKFVDFSLSAGVSVKFSYTQQFLVWVIPMYLKFTANAGLKLAFTCAGEIIELENTRAFFDLLDLTFSIGMRLDAGIGISDFISAGVYGGYTFKATKYGLGSNWDNEDGWYLRSEFAYGIKLQLLFLQHEIGKTFTVDHLGSAQNKQANLMARSYSFDMLLSENQIFSSSYQNSKPQLVQINDEKYLLTWIEDSVNRDTYNRTVLKYAIYESGVWSDAQSVLDDDKSDYYHDCYFDGEKIYIVWQKASSVFSGTDDFETIGESFEVYFSEFDTENNEFITAERLTDNNELDMAPKFAKKQNVGDPLTIIWQKNSENNLLGVSGTNSIYAIERHGNGGWSSSKKIYETDNYISFVSGAIKDKKLAVAFMFDLDNDILTEDRIVKTVYKNEIKILEENDAYNVQFQVIKGDAILFYYSQGEIYASRNLEDKEVFLDNSEGLIADNFSIVENENGKIIFYEKVVDDVRQALCAMYDEDEHVWTYDILLTNESHRVYNSTGFINSEGSISLVYNVQNEDEISNICFLEKTRLYEIQVQGLYALNFIEDGKDATFIINLLNCGDYNLHKLQFSAFDQNFVMILDEPLKVNESRSFEVSFIAKASDDSFEQITVKGVYNELIVCETRYVIETVFTDIAIDGFIQIEANKQVFTLSIKNNSSAKTNAVLIIKINGNPSLLQENIFLDSFELIEKQISFDMINKDDVVSFEIITDIADFYEYNNKLILKSIISESNEIFNYPENKYYKLLNSAKLLF